MAQKRIKSGPRLLTSYTFNVELGNHGIWYATSPDVKGLLVAEHTLAACLSAIAPTMERMDLARSLKEDATMHAAHLKLMARNFGR